MHCTDSSCGNYPREQQHAYEFLVYIIAPVSYKKACVVPARWQYSEQKFMYTVIVTKWSSRKNLA